MRTTLIAALLVCLVVPASAQPSDDAVRAAEAHYKQGAAFFAAGDFGKALGEFQASYDLVPEPLLLFNMGLCYREGGRKREALDHFRRYVEQQPDGDRADEASEYIAALTAELEAADADAKRQREADAAAEAERRRKAAECQRAEAERQRLVESERRRADDRARERSRHKKLRIAGLATAGAGVLVLGLGGKLGLDARNIDDELSNHSGPWTDAELARAEDGDVANRRMIVAVSIGGAAVVGGTVLYLLGRRGGDDSERGVSIVPTADPSCAGLLVTGRF